MVKALIIVILILLPPLSWFLTRVVLNYSNRKNILDIPNERSSHNTAKPRGGGLAFVGTFLLFLLVMFSLKAITIQLFLALFGGGTLIALIGWLDDKSKGISIIPRLIIQIVAAVWAIYWLQGLPQLRIGDFQIHLGIIGVLFGVLGIVWITNLYNFMDGIDGIAASEAVCIGVFAGILLLIAGDWSMAVLCLALALSSFGFLIWNWAPSKIFMGDVGSSFLGFIIAILTISSENAGKVPAIIWVILLSVFLVDATVTLLRRICSGECWYKAHRTHAYQRATQIGYSHRQVTLSVLYINIILAAFAFIMWYFPSLSWLFLGITILGLLVVYFIVYFYYRLSLLSEPQALFAVTKEDNSDVK